MCTQIDSPQLICLSSEISLSYFAYVKLLILGNKIKTQTDKRQSLESSSLYYWGRSLFPRARRDIFIFQFPRPNIYYKFIFSYTK